MLMECVVGFLQSLWPSILVRRRDFFLAKMCMVDFSEMLCFSFSRVGESARLKRPAAF